MKEVAIIGIGRTKWGKYPDRTIEDLGREAAQTALKDANLTWQDIQYVVGGIDPYSGIPGQRILKKNMVLLLTWLIV